MKNTEASQTTCIFPRSRRIGWQVLLSALLLACGAAHRIELDDLDLERSRERDYQTSAGIPVEKTVKPCLGSILTGWLPPKNEVVSQDRTSKQCFTSPTTSKCAMLDARREYTRDAMFDVCLTPKNTSYN